MDNKVEADLDSSEAERQYGCHLSQTIHNKKQLKSTMAELNLANGRNHKDLQFIKLNESFFFLNGIIFIYNFVKTMTVKSSSIVCLQHDHKVSSNWSDGALKIKGKL